MSSGKNSRVERADLRLPQPLFKPNSWPMGDDLLVSASSLMWGGAFEKRLRAARTIQVEAPTQFWLEPEASLVRSRALEFDAEVSFTSAEPAQAPSLQDLAESLFKESFAKLPELTRRRLIDLYRRELNPKFESVSDLTYFSGFLKRSRELSIESIDLAAYEWAKFSVFTSPQNDQRGAIESDPTDVILNPTLEIPPALDSRATSLLALYRIAGEVREVSVDWQQAVVIDELRENGRLQIENLIVELDSKKIALHKTSSFDLVVRGLIDSGVLLLR